MKIAKDQDEAWEMQETYKGLPHGWIQWKGTNVCMDVYCKCGQHFHIDDEFAYFVKCPACKTIYHCNGHIELIEVIKDPIDCVVGPEINADINGNIEF